MSITKKKNNNKRHHAYLAEDEDEERPRNKNRGEYVQEYVLFSALSGSVAPGEDTWIIDSGASKHMIGKKKNLPILEENKYPRKVLLGDDYQYPIKGIGESSYKIDSTTSMNMKEVLSVLGLKKNLLSISAIDKKGYRVAFIDGQVLMWSKGKTLEDVVVIGE